MILKSFEEAGYYVKYPVLNAADFGIPQKRERVFIIGFREFRHYMNFIFPHPITKTNKVSLSSVLTPDDEISEKYYFSDKAVAGMMRVREKMNKGRVQNINEPCNTISTHLAKVSLNGTDPVLMIENRYRRFTPREAASIQSFPNNFKLASVSEARQYKAIGNAVPPVLMWHITRSVISCIHSFKDKLVHERAEV